MLKGLNLNVADFVFSILPTATIKGFSIDKNYTPFKTERKSDIVLRVSRKKTPRNKINEYSFITSTWDYYQSKNRHIYNFFSSDKNKISERTLILESDFKKGEIILPHGTVAKNGVIRNPFSYPLDELIIINLLYQKCGLLVHSSGFAYKNKGYLFIGSSGAGKSTFSNIIRINIDVPILSDDRIAVRKRNGRFYIYGTPWHGTAEFVSPEKSPLSGLFFLKKGIKNYLQKLSVSDTVSRLFKCSFPPFWDKKGISSTLKICEDIATSIPSFEFSFTPDDRAFDLMRKERFI